MFNSKALLFFCCIIYFYCHLLQNKKNMSLMYLFPHLKVVHIFLLNFSYRNLLKMGIHIHIQKVALRINEKKITQNNKHEECQHLNMMKYIAFIYGMLYIYLKNVVKLIVTFSYIDCDTSQ